MTEKSPETTSETAIELIGVWKIYRQGQRSGRLRDSFKEFFRPQVREIEALRDVDLRIRRGEIVAYAGPNGAGKSTTIKLLSGLLAPNRGTVRSLGMDPGRDRVKYVKRIGVVFGQRTELWWDLPISASFEWKRVVWDVPRATYDRMLRLVTDLLGLDEFAHTMARELSLGQKMRADLGMALLHDPEILLLDEPTIGLDVLVKRRVLDFIKQLNRERGTTVIVTSHDMGDLEQLAGRIVLINRGDIAYDGDFHGLPGRAAGRRKLILETRSSTPPVLEDARHVESQGVRHTYEFNATATRLPALLAEAASQTEVVDVETQRPDIDDVIADLYEGWLAPSPPARAVSSTDT
jgi:ABC-2 type transport system ATP-binding protein